MSPRSCQTLRTRLNGRVLDLKLKLGWLESHQNYDKIISTLQLAYQALPTQRVNKIASRLGSPRCLDILKAWQRVQLKSIVIENNGGDHGSNLHSPTSTLNLQNIPASSTNCNIASFHSNDVNEGFATFQDMEFEAGQAWSMGACYAGNDDLIKGFSNFLSNNWESDHLVRYPNTDKDGNSGSSDGVSENDDENKNYLDDVFNLVDCGLRYTDSTLLHNNICMEHLELFIRPIC